MRIRTYLSICSGSGSYHSLFPRVKPPTFPFDAHPDPAFHLRPRIRILPDPAFHFDVDPDPTFHSDADPALQIDADPDPYSSCRRMRRGAESHAAHPELCGPNRKRGASTVGHHRPSHFLMRYSLFNREFCRVRYIVLDDFNCTWGLEQPVVYLHCGSFCLGYTWGIFKLQSLEAL